MTRLGRSTLLLNSKAPEPNHALQHCDHVINVKMSILHVLQFAAVLVRHESGGG